MKAVFMDVDTKETIVPINKDFANGFGIRPRIGNSLLARFLEHMRGKEKVPLFSFAQGAAMLHANGFEVSYSLNEIPGEADLVMFAPAMANHKSEIKKMHEVKERVPGVKVGVMGTFATVRPDVFVEHADFVIAGEPEEALQKIKGKDSIPQGIVKSESLMDLDALPFPKWDIFDYKKFTFKPIIRETPFGFILSQRTCPYGCYYCPYRFGGKYRQKSPERTVEEVEHLVNRYGVKGIMFRDPIFSMSRERAEKIAKLLIEKNLGIKFVIETRLDRLDKELVDLLYEAGVRVIKIGVESADKKMLVRSRRLPIEIQHQEDMIGYCDKKGIKIVAFYIIGLPDDTKDNVLNTIEYAKRINTHGAQFTVCTPYPGTPYFEEVKDLIDDHNLEHYDSFTPVFNHPNLTKDEIYSLKEKAYLSYYIRQKYVLSYIRRSLKA